MSDQITFMESSDSVGQASDERASNHVAKSASRIALYMMREEYKDSAKNSSKEEGPVQHSHDFFVISSCRIEVGLKENRDDKEEEGDCNADATFPICVDNETVRVPERMLPGSVSAATAILNRHGLDINGRQNNATEKKKKVFLPKTGVSLEEHFEKLSGLTAKQREETRKVLDFISQSRDKGVTGRELKGMRANGVEQRLRELMSTGAVIRTGIVSSKFIASSMATPWMLTSFRLTRVRDREKMETMRKGPAVTTLCMDGDGEPREEQFHARSKRPRRQSTAKVQNQESEEKTKNPCERTRRRSGAQSQDDEAPKSGSSLDPPSSVAEAASRVDWDRAEQVCFLIRPWLRVDGTLNRRVFDRLLGAVLGHSMQKPGQTVEDICARFSPALQPAHTSELINVLDELGCIKVMALRKPDGGRVGLFSAAPALKLEEPSLLDEADELVVEAVVDAIIRLGQFIGDKQYTIDFVCQCPCHPDRRL